jgi:hypothetical protein
LIANGRGKKKEGKSGVGCQIKTNAAVHLSRQKNCFAFVVPVTWASSVLQSSNDCYWPQGSQISRQFTLSLSSAIIN